MIRFLIHRPIAVLMTFFVLLIFGILSLQKLPVSLLPSIDIPQIIIKINYGNTSAAAIEENIVKPIRENFSTLQNVKDVESTSSNHSGIVYLTYEFGTKMDLAYIEANEKLDRLSNFLPKDLPRPQVVRINTSDIPIIRVQVIPKNQNDFLQISEVTEKVIRKRIEQIDGVSLVDVNGRQNGVINILPNREKLNALGIDETVLSEEIKKFNQQLSSLSVKDGHYRFFVSLDNQLENVHDLQMIPIKLAGGGIIPLGEVAQIANESERVTGSHIFNGKEGLVITVHKQSKSRMNELVPKIREAISVFNRDYPQIDFDLSQDQTFVLNAGIDNLNQDLIYGGILCVILLFMFLGNYAASILMSISIPASLILTFIFFYLFDISLNIISLSGLALGVGMLVDNSIVVLDNITRKRRDGLPMDESCEKGVNEVVVPVISQVLTTVAVYAPLVYLSGLAGALVFDQAIALTISLFISLAIAFFLNPVLYKIFLKKDPKNLKEDTIFYTWISSAYHSMITNVFRRKKRFFIFTLSIMPIGLILLFFIPIASLPDIKSQESVVRINWNEPVDARENKRRVLDLMANEKNEFDRWEADIGTKQFLLQQENSSASQAEIYYDCGTSERKKRQDLLISELLRKDYPIAGFVVEPAPNSFTQLFEDRTPYLEARFKTNRNDELNTLLEETAPKIRDSWEVGNGFVEEQNIDIVIDNTKLALYDVDFEVIKNKLERIFGQLTITEIKRFGEVRVVRFKAEDSDIESQLRTTVVNSNGVSYPIKAFVDYKYDKQPKYITADRSGVYKSLVFKNVENAEFVSGQIADAAIHNNLEVTFKGKYFDNLNLARDLFVIFIISTLLLYFILVAQFENLIHPILVMLTMPLGISGALLALYLTGGTLDIMACIGLVVVLGLIVDDPILKVETINRLLRQDNQHLSKREALEKSIHEAGEICLKPLLMTSLTTSLALIPILFTGGIGSDLQKPLVWVIVGGLSIGTFFTLWFIPLAYWFVAKKS